MQGGRPIVKLRTRDEPPPAKHMAYFDVLKALEGAACPICALGRRAVARYLDNLSYENVNDPGVRAALRASRGFCNPHAWQFATEVRDGLGTAIIYADIVGMVTSVLDVNRAPRASGAFGGLATLLGRIGRAAGPTAIRAHLMPAGQCPACRFLARMSRVYLRTLVAHLSEPELWARYRQSNGLCIPHLLDILPALPSADDVRLLTEVAAGRLASLHEPGHDATAVVATLTGQWGIVDEARSAVSGGLAPPADDAAVDQQALDRAVQQDGCPLCSVALAAVDAHVQRIAAEVTSNARLAAELAASRGLCNHHATRALTHLSPPAMIGIWRPIITATLQTLRTPASPEGSGHDRRRRLAGLRAPTNPGSELAARLTQRRPCPTCRVQVAAECGAARTLLDRVQRRPAEGGRAGLAQWCLPHIIEALRQETDHERTWLLLSSVAPSFRRLRDELNEYIRKQDYRFRAEPRGSEEDSPWRAIARVAGAKELKGIERRQG